MGELDGGGDAELREARDVGRVDALRVLDPRPQPAPRAPRGREGVERVAVRPVADGVDGEREPVRGGAADQARERRRRT